MIRVEFDPFSFEEWRERALELLTAKVRPEDLSWNSQGAFLFEELWTGGPKGLFKVPKEFHGPSRIVFCHSDPAIPGLLYRLLWRIVSGERELLQDALDPDVLEFHARERAVTKDLHKMKAFVRFRKTIIDQEEWFVAWHCPDHRIMDLAATFFRERFKGMKWSILTPVGCAHWDGEEMHRGPGVEKPAGIEDEQEDLWKTYYSSIFNPARIKIKAMKKELPVRHWKTLPETELINSLLDEAPARLKEFYESQLPQLKTEAQNLEELSAQLKKCHHCGICAKATAPVPGLGPLNAELMLVGEQPGDEEDKAGIPFIGPAGRLLDQALLEAGIKRDKAYVTNAVKGFKWLPKEHRRWHRSADGREISACRPWLKSEVTLVKPKILVCLGRSAAQSLLGKLVRLEDHRGRFFPTAWCDQTIVLPHPSSILRTQDAHEREAAYARFVSELKLISSRIA